MTAIATPSRSRVIAIDRHERTLSSGRRAPIVAAVDGSSASTAAAEATVQLGIELDAPVVFVHVRRGPAGFFGDPVYLRSAARPVVAQGQKPPAAARAV
jgi:nucleotide-binding universal stress UspA family protein